MEGSSVRIGGIVVEDHRKAMGKGIGVSQFCFMELPLAVLYVILFRLPINSIMKLKLVCRALHKILSNPDFALNYSNNSPFATFLLPKIRNDALKRPANLYLLEISDSSEYIRTPIFKPKIPGWSKRSSIFSIVGACNGLFCFSVYKLQTQKVYVCNPITGECLELAEHKTKHGEKGVEYGFGFCRSTNNYKVLKIVCKSWELPAEREGEILTVGVDDRWRVLDRVVNPTIPLPVSIPDSVRLNETLHWIAMDIGSTWISTFDFGEEKIGRLSHPHGMELDFICMNLTSINNQLCLVDKSNCQIVLWKMKQYAVAESWTKDMVLDMSVSPEFVQLRRLSLVRILENGDMLFSRPSKDYTISYSPTTRELTEIEVPCFGSIDYSPSFLPLKETITGGHLNTIKVMSK